MRFSVHHSHDVAGQQRPCFLSKFGVDEFNACALMVLNQFMASDQAGLDEDARGSPAIALSAQDRTLLSMQPFEPTSLSSQESEEAIRALLGSHSITKVSSLVIHRLLRPYVK